MKSWLSSTMHCFQNLNIECTREMGNFFSISRCNRSCPHIICKYIFRNYSLFLLSLLHHQPKERRWKDEDIPCKHKFLAQCMRRYLNKILEGKGEKTGHDNEFVLFWLVTSQYKFQHQLHHHHRHHLHHQAYI